MSKYTKPDMSKVWAETGSIIQPLDSKISTGWIVEKPKFENMNWVQNRQDSMLRYINQLGIPEWDAVTQYIANQSYIQSATTGIVYKCILTHGGVGGTAHNPDADLTNTYWVVAFDASGSAATVAANLATLSANYVNLTGVNAANGRTSLSVYSKAYIDTLFASIPKLTGSVAYFTCNTAPAGTVEGKGQLVSRTGVYAALWAFAQTSGNITANDAAWSHDTTAGMYSPGDGSTTFRLPDLRGAFLRGWADDSALDSGRAIGSYQADALQGHEHRYLAPTGSGTAASGGVGSSTQTTSGIVADGSHGTPRIASETRPVNIAQLGVIFL